MENQADARVAHASLVRMAEALDERDLLALGALVSLGRQAAKWRERAGNGACYEVVAQWRARLPPGMTPHRV